MEEKPEKPIRTAIDPGRPVREIVADLSKPIAPKHLSTRKQGGQTLTYIAWYHAVKYLDFYAPGWTYQIMNSEIVGNSYILTVRLSIPCAEGVVFREATGYEDIDAKGYGDVSSNAESMALRRAAAKFGLGRDLYEKA